MRVGESGRAVLRRCPPKRASTRLKNFTRGSITQISSSSPILCRAFTHIDPSDDARATGQTRLQLVSHDRRHAMGLHRKTDRSRGAIDGDRFGRGSPLLVRTSRSSNSCRLHPTRGEKHLLCAQRRQLGPSAVERARLPSARVGLFASAHALRPSKRATARVRIGSPGLDRSGSCVPMSRRMRGPGNGKRTITQGSPNSVEPPLRGPP